MRENYIEKDRQIVENMLDNILPKKTARPSVIHDAMRYSIFSGGKRIRPIILMESAAAAGRKTDDAVLLGCAIELIHTYSLIHDDLPSMDNADMRRGKPSCHVKYGEANAILAGDALLTLAFNAAARIKDTKKIGSIVLEISRAIGTFGMIGGQAMDLDIKDNTDLAAMEYINILKTGSLIKASCKIGGIISGADKKEVKALECYGGLMGLAFQVIDDILDNDGYAKILGINDARREAGDLICEAKRSLDIFDKKADNLKNIADFVLMRKK